MANKAERQLKELRRLMPWNWDSKIEEHPPGEKAMHDFEDVLAYNLDRRRRVMPNSNQAAAGNNGEPAAGNTKGPVCKPKVTPALSPKDQNTTVPSTAEAALQDKVNSNDDQDDHSALDEIAVADEANEVTDVLPLGSPDSTAADDSTLANAPTGTTAITTAAGVKPHVTPANRRKAIQTPSSRPSTSRNHAALADGQFQPTPRPTSTPATDIAKAHRKGNDKGTFRSPQPRTVFGNKRKAVTTAVEDSKIGGDSSTIKKNNTTSSIARLAAMSPLGAAAPKVASAGRNKKQHQNANKDPLAPVSFNLGQYNKGPVINRPDTCPPLFKSNASTGILGKTRPPLAPLPLPSAQKTSEAAALSGHFFTQEKGLVTFMLNNKIRSEKQQWQHRYPSLAPRPPMPLVVPAAIMPLDPDVPAMPAMRAVAAPAPGVGSTLGWAFSQLRQQQNQQ